MLNLKQARTFVNLSQSQLADVSGVKKSAISDIEQGRVQPEDVAYGTIVRIVRALQRSGLPGMTSDELFPVREQVAA
jgi:predicted transcriptional regulator